MTSLLQAYTQCVLEHPHSLGIPSPHRGGPEILNSASFMSTFAILFFITHNSLLTEMNNSHYVYSFTKTIKSLLHVHLNVHLCVCVCVCVCVRLMINKIHTYVLYILCNGKKVFMQNVILVLSFKPKRKELKSF